MQAAHSHCRAEARPEVGNGNAALSRLPAAKAAPAEGAACDSWQVVLSAMWHIGLPAVAEIPREWYHGCIKIRKPSILYIYVLNGIWIIDLRV